MDTTKKIQSVCEIIYGFSIYYRVTYADTSRENVFYCHRKFLPFIEEGEAS